MRRPLAAPLAILLGLLVGVGCGGSKETGSARERDEERPYGRVVVRSEAMPRRVTLGDPLVWTLTAKLPASSEPLEGIVDPTPASLDVVARGEPTVRKTGAGVTWSRKYEVRGFDLGALALPGARLAVRIARSSMSDTLTFPFDSIAVDSLTPASTGVTAPDRGPIDPGLRPIDWAVVGAIALVVAVALVLLFRSLRRGRGGRPEAALSAEPPEPRFARALEALRQDGPTLARDAFHERLSDAIRRYVADVTGIDTIDLTTRELERELKRSPRARSEAAGEIVRILRRSDLVKFARLSDAWEEAQALLGDAARLSGTVAVPADARPPTAATRPTSAKGANSPTAGPPTRGGD